MSTHTILKGLMVTVLGAGLALLAVVWTDAVAPGLDVTAGIEATVNDGEPSTDTPTPLPSGSF